MISDIYTNSGVSEEEVSLKAVAFITYLLILAFLVLVFSIRLYVGKCAKGEGLWMQCTQEIEFLS